MLCGLGEVGSEALELFSRSEGIDKIVASDINEEWGTKRMAVAAIGSVYQGFNKKFEFHKNDVNDIDATAKLLAEIKPDAIFLTVTNVSGLSHRRFLLSMPEDIRLKIRSARSGVELPFKLLLPAKFMQAVNKSGIQTHVVNCMLPDVVGPVLWNRFGFGPTVGMGNHDLIAAMITKYVSITEGVPLQDVTLYFVTSHAIFLHGTREGVPFFLKILVRGRDITSKYDVNWLIDECILPIPWRVAWEKPTYSFIAASGVKNIMAMLNDTNEYTHAPSPHGLVGGYPVRLSAMGAEVNLPEDLTLEQAISINEGTLKFDGIENIKRDGTVIYTDETYSIIKELGYDCKELPCDFAELESRSEEIKALYRKFAA